ncbi:MAG: discoidin domain-containing protein, partial [Blastocatellia bacterium]
KARQEAFKTNLAKGLAKGKISASNIRGNNRKYGPDNVSDGDRQTYWATDDGARSAWLEIDFGREIEFNRFLAQENIALGQRVKRFSLRIWNGKDYEKIAENTTIGYQRILRLPNVRTSKLKFVIEDARACPAITNIEIYNAPPIIGANQ